MEYPLCLAMAPLSYYSIIIQGKRKFGVHLRIPHSSHLAPPYAFINFEMRAFCLTAQPT